MLILTRKVGESIKIGDDITVTVLDVYKDYVKLGISAPATIQVWREELYQERQRSRPKD